MQRLPDSIANIVNYLRRSRQDEEREKRTGEDTLSEQRELMDRVLLSYGIPYEQRFEIGSGDKIDTRPVFRQIIDDLRIGRFQAIAVKEISRMGRGSYTDMGVIYDLIVNNRIYIITPYRVYDPHNSSDLRQIRFEMFLSREEFESIRERMQGARYTYAQSGKWMVGKTPYGYTFNKHSQRLTPDEDTADIVRLMFDLYVNGLNGKQLGQRAIATYLQRLGIPTFSGKRTWHPMVVRQILSNPVYIGQVRFRTTRKRQQLPQDDWIVVDHAHEALIDDDTFKAAQERLSGQKKRQPSVKLDYSVSELAGIVTCGKCGFTMVRHVSKSRYKRADGSYSVYERDTLHCPTAGCAAQVKYADVQQRILQTIESMIEWDENALAASMEEVLSSERTEPTIDVKSMLTQQLTDLQHERDFVFAKHRQGVYDDDDFIRERDQIDKDIANVRQSLHDATTTQNSQAATLASVPECPKSLAALYNQSGETGKNNILRSIIKSVVLVVTQTGTRGRPTLYTLNCELTDAITR